MKSISNSWIIILYGVCFLCIIATGIVLCFYLTVFGNNISNEIQDWSLFLLLFNGITTTILTIVNISAIIKINSSIENKSEERHIKDLLFEAQTILAKMRLEDYKVVRELINEMKVSLYQDTISSEEIVLIKKKLMEIDTSFLYKSQKLHEQPFLRPITEKLVTQIDDVLLKNKNRASSSEIEKLQKTLSSFLNIMEFHIISQLIRSSRVQKYISKHQDELDCTISCVYDFAKEIYETINKEINNE